MRYHLLLIFVPLLTLTSCVSREQADQRLVKACEAGSALFLDEGYSVKKIKRSTVKPSLEFGSGYRQVTLFALESDGWAEFDKEYKCTFAEEMGLMGMYHRASIYQIKVNDQIYGRDGDKILGEMEDHIKLENAIQDALEQ